MEAKNAALFITDGIKMKMVLRENATIYEMLHELMHFRHSQKIGLKNYYDFGKQGFQGTLIRERYVFDKLMEHSKYLNRDELLHARQYLNGKYYEFGVEKVVDFSFDITKKPKKRQEVNIDVIINLK